jgi:AraC-like DNA-binding protein
MSVGPAEEHRLNERRKQMAQLKLAGVDWQTIADRCGYSSAQYAQNDWQVVRNRTRAELRTSVEEARWLEVSRLDRLQAAVWPKAMKGDTKAADSAHRYIVTRCKILGLEAPTQIQLSARLDLESTIVAEAIIAAIDALGLSPDQRVVAFNAAQSRLELASAETGDEETI